LAAYLKPEQHLQAQTVFSQERKIRIFSVDDSSGISNHIKPINAYRIQFQLLNKTVSVLALIDPKHPSVLYISHKAEI